MNPEAQAELDRILAISPEELTEAEQGFLQARRSYLTEEQRINFGVVEGNEKAGSATSEEELPTELDAPPVPKSKGKSVRVV